MCSSCLFYDPVQVYGKPKYKGRSGEGISGGRHRETVRSVAALIFFYENKKFYLLIFCRIHTTFSTPYVEFVL